MSPEKRRPIEQATPQEKPIFDRRRSKREWDPESKELYGLLQQGTERVLTSEGFQSYLRMLSLFHDYSANNILLILAQFPEATKVNSKDRWEQLGRTVTEPERQGIKIYYPRFYYHEDPTTGEQIKLISGYGVGNVWDISQTDGEPLPSRPPEPAPNTSWTEESEGLYKRIEEWVSQQGVRVTRGRPPQEGVEGQYSPSNRAILVCHDVSLNDYDVAKVRVLAHEASHFVAQHTRQMPREDAEVVADSSAWATLYHFGFDLGDASFHYVAAWAKSMKVVRRNLDDIRKVSHALISGIEQATASNSRDIPETSVQDIDII